MASDNNNNNNNNNNNIIINWQLINAIKGMHAVSRLESRMRSIMLDRRKQPQDTPTRVRPYIIWLINNIIINIIPSQ